MSRKVLFFTLWERIWHWTQALGIIILILTGFQMHYPTGFPLFGGLDTAVTIHDTLGVILLFNAFLGLFYSVTTAKIREYIPMPLDFSRGTIEQAKYYLWGIFHQQPHPYDRIPGKKLNPLQKITYFFLLNLLLPLQLISGALLLSTKFSPGFIEHVGGMRLIASIHTVGAFFFFSFVIVHIYLTTTGHTPLELVKEMITGYGEVEKERGEEI